MIADSDRLLVEQIRQGNMQAWDQLIHRYEGRLLAFIERRLQDRTAAEDVVQETFIGFVNSLPNYDIERDLQTYLFTIAAHKLTDHLRKMGRHPFHHVPDGQEFFQQQIAEQQAASSLARSRERKTLEAEALCKVLRELIDDWKNKGDMLRLKVFELLQVKGWKNKKVAEFLQIKEQDVANIRFAAVSKIKEQMRNLGLPIDVFPGLSDGGNHG